MYILRLPYIRMRVKKVFLLIKLSFFKGKGVTCAPDFILLINITVL